MNLKKRILFLTLIAILLLTIVLAAVMCLRKRSMSQGSPPQVEGWAPEVSRNISDYISEYLKPHIFPENFCRKKGLLLAIVCSRPTNFEARQAIRETWGHKRDNVSIYFLLGESKDSDTYQIELEIEGQRYGDIIQERFLDSYNNLTLKSVNMLKLFNLYCSNSYKYLMKVDDDVIVNIDLIVDMLANRNSTTNVLIGKIINDTSPFRDTSSKWYVPYNLYPEEKYPDYLCGPTYIMSVDVAEKLYNCAWNTPIFYIEDVYVTGLCAIKANVTPQHHSLFTCNEVKKDYCLYKTLYSVHFFTPDVLREAYDTMQKSECPRKTSLFDLRENPSKSVPTVLDLLLQFFMKSKDSSRQEIRKLQKIRSIDLST